MNALKLKTKKINILSIFLILSLLNLPLISQAESTNKKTEVKKKSSPTPAPVKLASNEYLIQYKNKDIRFKTKTTEQLELSENCFKKNKPDCEAYKKSLVGTKESLEKHMISPTHNNMAAINCSLIGGEGIIVKTSSGNESDFCEFKDGSKVSSWSAYYKTNSGIKTK